MTTLQDVAREARAGATAETIAARLGASTGLVDAMLDELSRHALVTPAPARTHGGSGCGTTSGALACSTTVSAPSCAGCPLASGQAPASTGAGTIRFLPWVRVRPAESAAAVPARTATRALDA